MYVLILIFINATTSLPTPSEHAMPYTSVNACAEAGRDFSSYEAGVEAGKAKAAGGKADTVYWYCVPVKAPGATT